MKNNAPPPALYPATYEAHIVVAAGENTPERLVHIVLDRRETAHVVAFASDCGLTLDAFVHAHIGPGLPSQDQWRGPELATLPVSVMKIDGVHPELRARIERAAKFEGGESGEEFISAAVANRVERAEHDMLFNVQTGEPVPRERLMVNLRRNEEQTAPTLRQQRSEVPRHVALSPGHEEKWAARRPLPRVSPLVTHNALMLANAPLKPLSVTLNSEATAAVWRCHQVTGDEFADIASGVLAGEIERALAYVARRDELGWQRLTQDIAVAIRLRIDCGAKPRHDTDGLEHTITLKFEPEAHTQLVAAAVEGGYISVEAMIQQVCLSACRRP